MKRKHNNYRDTFPVTCTLLLLGVSMCRTLPLDTKALIKVKVTRYADPQGNMPTGRECKAVGGQEATRLRHHFSFVP